MNTSRAASVSFLDRFVLVVRRSSSCCSSSSSSEVSTTTALSQRKRRRRDSVLARSGESRGGDSNSSSSSSSSEDALSSLEALGIVGEKRRDEDKKEEEEEDAMNATTTNVREEVKKVKATEDKNDGDEKLPVLFRMIKKAARPPPRATSDKQSNPLNRPKYQQAEGVTKYWSPLFSPLSNIYNVPTEEPTAAERLAVLHLFFFAADFVAVKSGANTEGGFFFSNFALFADAVKTQNEWWRLPSTALADFGLEHVLATNVSLWLIGREIETLLGTTSFLGVYFLGGTAGAIATLAFDDNSKVIAGSSGAVFALYGAILTYTVLNLESGWNQRGFTTRLFRIGASAIALCYIASETASDGATHVVNNWDHLGGFLSGILLAYYGLCPLFSSIQFKPGEEKNRAQRLNLEDKTLEEPFAKTSAILYGVCANLVAASLVVAFKRMSGIDDF
jgi:membrane associated rhomboid family serine protease